MSSPIVYLGPAHSGKELFHKLCLQNNYKSIFIRGAVNLSVGIPKSKTEYHRKRYIANVNGELHVFERLFPIDMGWHNKRVNRMKGPNTDNFDPGKLTTSHILKIISENTDCYSFVLGLEDNQLLPILLAPHFRKCRIFIPYRKHGFKKQLLQYLNEAYHLGFTQSLGQSCEESCKYIDGYLDQYQFYVDTLNDLYFPYEFIDMSDPDMYNNLGINSDHIEFDYEKRVFAPGDPGWENLAETYDDIKLSFDYVNHFIKTRKDRITSLFPDIVL